MTGHVTSPANGRLEPENNRSSAKRGRGPYRQQLTAAGPGRSAAGTEARRLAAVILEVLAGVQTPTSAALALGIRPPRYYFLEQRALGGLVSACEPGPRDARSTATGRLPDWSGSWRSAVGSSGGTRLWPGRRSASWG